MGSNPLFMSRGGVSSQQPGVEFYTDDNGKYRWKLLMSGDEVGAATQSYISKEECVEDLTKIAQHILDLARGGKLQ